MDKIVVTEEMVTRAYRVFMEEASPPYTVDINRFSDEEIKSGKLREAGDKAYAMNLALVRRVLETAIKE